MVETSMLETKRSVRAPISRATARHRQSFTVLLGQGLPANYGSTNLPVSSAWPAERPTSTSKSPGSAFHW